MIFSGNVFKPNQIFGVDVIRQHKFYMIANESFVCKEAEWISLVDCKQDTNHGKRYAKNICNQEGPIKSQSSANGNLHLIQSKRIKDSYIKLKIHGCRVNNEDVNNNKLTRVKNCNLEFKFVPSEPGSRWTILRRSFNHLEAKGQ